MFYYLLRNTSSGTGCKVVRVISFTLLVSCLCIIGPGVLGVSSITCAFSINSAVKLQTFSRLTVVKILFDSSNAAELFELLPLVSSELSSGFQDA